METRLTLRPGERGTKKLLDRYGDRLVRVRYRYDPKQAMRYTTVELIVAHSPWIQRARSRKRPRSPDEMVHVRVTYDQIELRTKLKAIGAIWRPRHRLWELPWGAAQALGLEGRIVVEPQPPAAPERERRNPPRERYIDLETFPG
jgi:hypothetical protein